LKVKDRTKTATLRYIEGSRFAHDRKAIDRKVEQVEAVAAALTDKSLDLAREVFFVIIINEESSRAVIVNIVDEYEDAKREAEVCFSALHEIGLPFRWGIRIDRSYLRAK
jgi:hypothetical protein